MSDSVNTVLQASELYRKLSDTASVQDITLNLNRGDVLGLLGLNGAGKSTILRMLSGTLIPDSGEITIAGYSLSEQPLLARQQLGFLPDQPPLYNDMRVTDFLTLCAKLRRVPANSVKTGVADVLARCDINDVCTKRIGQLSKGYKQRVGLAQALVHKPAVLLLDEPSNGLDPNQMQGMREIITSFSQDHAVIFSTHLLNEAQAVCNRIAVVHEGKFIHEDTMKGGDSQLEDLFLNLTKDRPQASVA